MTSIENYVNIDFEELIKKIKNILDCKKDEWVQRFKGYAEEINESLIIDSKKYFRVPKPLYLYSNITQSKKGNQFSLRYMGQNVANIEIINKKVYLSTDLFHNEIKKDFKDYNLKPINHEELEEWNSLKSKEFRNYFLNKPEREKDIKKEHRLESLLLSDLSQAKGSNKLLKNIQPVYFSGVARFQMPTSLSASTSSIKYSKTGGHIDILARIGKGKSSKLCVMELKYNNKKSEPPQKVIRQSLAYAVFIRELLRDEQIGKLWYKLLGFSGIIPKVLNIYSVCVMRSNELNDYSIKNKSIDLDGDKIHLHYIYYDHEGEEITVKKDNISL